MTVNLKDKWWYYRWTRVTNIIAKQSLKISMKYDSKIRRPLLIAIRSVLHSFGINSNE